MERSQTDAAHVIPRYLAGQLSAEEASAFEEVYARDPALVAEIERTLRFKEGMATLRDRGELARILRPGPRRGFRVGLAVAATLAVIAVGLTWYQHSGPHSSQLSFPPVLTSAIPSALPVLHRYALVRTREAVAPPIDIPLSAQAGGIELRILPSSVATQEGYAVRLVQLAGSTRQTLSHIDSVTAARDRYVLVYIDQRQLPRGDYELSLAPDAAALESPQADRFILRVR